MGVSRARRDHLRGFAGSRWDYPGEFVISCTPCQNQMVGEAATQEEINDMATALGWKLGRCIWGYDFTAKRGYMVWESAVCPKCQVSDHA